jgi:hypothetical protein
MISGMSDGAWAAMHCAASADGEIAPAGEGGGDGGGGGVASDRKLEGGGASEPFAPLGAGSDSRDCASVTSNSDPAALLAYACLSGACEGRTVPPLSVLGDSVARPADSRHVGRSRWVSGAGAGEGPLGTCAASRLILATSSGRH